VTEICLSKTADNLIAGVEHRCLLLEGDLSDNGLFVLSVIL